MARKSAEFHYFLSLNARRNNRQTKLRRVAGRMERKSLTFNLISSDDISIFTDGTFIPKKLFLAYMRYPLYIDKEWYIFGEYKYTFYNLEKIALVN